jgi:exo-beta-1,3-glucanase (GH17 family)
MKIPYKKAICYSGYRENQSPVTKVYPTYEQVLEDLKILEKDFQYIRMYDASEHCKTTLEVIRNEGINLKVLIGIDLLGEASNPQCAWGGDYTDLEVKRNIAYNEAQLQQAIKLANEYSDILLGVSAGNEAVPEWNENLVTPERVLYFVKELKKHTTVPVTYCDNNYYWRDHLKKVAKEVDFISIHIYPAWLGMKVEEGITVTVNDYKTIQKLYPKKQVIITETGWPTTSHGRGIPRENASEINQRFFNKEIDRWSEKEGIPVFFFEAFDEPWKGSSNPDEPEKHWGYYFVNRTPKLIQTKEYK